MYTPEAESKKTIVLVIQGGLTNFTLCKHAIFLGKSDVIYNEAKRNYSKGYPNVWYMAYNGQKFMPNDP